MKQARQSEWNEKLSFFSKNKDILIFFFFISLGIFLLIAFFWIIRLPFFKETDDGNIFPWTFITALVAGPVTLYLWYWKNLISKHSIDDSRFHSSIHDLSSDKLHVRLAGIYALENLVNNNSKRTPNVVEVLASYLRCNTLISTRKEFEELKIENKICVDILSRIWKKNMKYWDFHLNGKPDLRYLKMNNYELWGVNLNKFFLEEIDFSYCCLKAANFSESRLEFSILKHTILEDVNFNKSYLYGADLSESEGLTQAQIESSFGCIETKLPDGINMPKIWKDGVCLCQKSILYKGKKCPNTPSNKNVG